MSERERKGQEKLIGVAAVARQKGRFIMKKYCTKCGKPFEAVGREVICPSCKAQAAEDAKRAAVLKAKRASWTGESVPVRISGRASTVIRRYGADNNLPFAQALDALLQSTSFFVNLGTEWNTIQPYKSHRRDKTAGTTETAENTQEAVGKPQEVKQAARVTKPATASKATSKPQAAKAASKASANKADSK